MCDKKEHTKMHYILARRDHLKSLVSTTEGKQEYKKLLSIIRYCLNSLEYDYKEIIRSSYLNKNYKFWWTDHYCQSSYYRKRNKAVVSFVHLFNLIYENFDDFSANIYRAI